MSIPLVSVVIPTYNQPAYLMEAIDSVLNQTMKDFEIIVVNDGSTDDTLNHLAKYGEGIQVITQENAWIGAARNRGIAAARGKYIALLDHDDLWQAEKLQVQVDFFQSHPECIGVGVHYAYSNAPGRPLFRAGDICDSNRIVQRPFLQLAKGVVFIQTAALMFDRERAEGLKYGTKRNAIEDIQFHIGLLSRGAFGIAGEKPLSIWREHAQNSSRQTFYYYGGLRSLRELEARGEYKGLNRQDRRDLSEYFAKLGRVTAVQMLVAKERRKAIAVYFTECLHQLWVGQLKFVLGFPALIFAPAVVRSRLWKFRS